MPQQEIAPQTQPRSKSGFVAALPLWMLCVIAGLLLWQVFELNSNLRTHNDRLFGTMNALQNLDSHYMSMMREQDGYLSGISNSIEGINNNVAGVNKKLGGVKEPGK